MAKEDFSFSENVYGLGVDLISALQSTFPGGETIFIDVSLVFDPKYVFTIYFPLLFALHWVVGVQVLGTIVVVEWLNQILKWLMHGERPYWWVHEMEEAHKADVHPHKISEIHQYSSTCETGPGMPSGHSMAMSAAWYVIIHAVVEHVVDPSDMSAKLKRESKQLLWSVYIIIQALVIFSRLYIAAHFPHQCLLGLILGICMAKLAFGSTEWMNFGRLRWILVSSVIMSSALGTYSFLLLTGRDPSWSISEALKWCDKAENIHIDTMPFYSMMRYSGAAFGLGLGLTSRFFTATKERMNFTRLQTFANVVLGLALGYASDMAHAAIPKTNETLFYGLGFLLNVTFPYAVIALVPYTVMAFSGRKEKSA